VSYYDRVRRIDKVILHCSASDYKYQDVDWIRQIHMTERGWSDIGYHFFIPYSGVIQRGRPMENIGAHVRGKNKYSLGICLAGNRTFKPVQFESLQTLLLLLKRLYPHSTLHGHKEFNRRKTGPNFPYEGFVNVWNAIIL